MSGLLPLSLEVVGPGISQLTMGALLVGRGAVGGRQKTRAIGRFEDLVFWEYLVFLDGNPRSMEWRAGGFVGSSRTHQSGAMTPSCLCARLYLFPSASETLLVYSGDHPHPLPNWQWVVPTRHYNLHFPEGVPIIRTRISGPCARTLESPLS